jgi:gluconate kinase
VADQHHDEQNAETNAEGNVMSDDDKKPTDWLGQAQMLLLTVAVVVAGLLLLRWLGLR